MIHTGGIWLERLDFKIGGRILVEYEPGRDVITPFPDPKVIPMAASDPSALVAEPSVPYPIPYQQPTLSQPEKKQ